MSKRKLRTGDYLDHILQAIERIERYTAAIDVDAFMLDQLVQDAVIRNIEILGEAANNITKTDPSFANKNSEIPWATIYTMRNRVSHAYFQVDLGVVWNTIQNDLPKMKQQVQALVDSFTN
jgi:uncharacterized protein with HEPN domain